MAQDGLGDVVRGAEARRGEVIIGTLGVALAYPVGDPAAASAEVVEAAVSAFAGIVYGVVRDVELPVRHEQTSPDFTRATIGLGGDGSGSDGWGGSDWGGDSWDGDQGQLEEGS
ncbi:hypothetical protein KJ359_001136 [Pestalotiopsis sp. 9143b]|nr:hypothetical protein KJ359_001136 [Pestalotiopsis sp. 9143b]